MGGVSGLRRGAVRYMERVAASFACQARVVSSGLIGAKAPPGAPAWGGLTAIIVPDGPAVIAFPGVPTKARRVGDAARGGPDGGRGGRLSGTNGAVLATTANGPSRPAAITDGARATARGGGPKASRRQLVGGM